MVKQFSNPQFSSPPPEDMPVSVNFSFTFNPSDQYQCWGCVDPKERFKKVHQSISEIFSYFSNSYYTEGYLEVSKAGRVHYHGVIRMIDTFCFFMSTIPFLKRYGTYEIDYIESPDTWEEYCVKQQFVIPLEKKYKYVTNETPPKKLVLTLENPVSIAGDLQDYGVCISEQQVVPSIDTKAEAQAYAESYEREKTRKLKAYNKWVEKNAKTLAQFQK